MLTPTPPSPSERLPVTHLAPDGKTRHEGNSRPCDELDCRRWWNAYDDDAQHLTPAEMEDLGLIRHHYGPGGAS